MSVVQRQDQAPYAITDAINDTNFGISLQEELERTITALNNRLRSLGNSLQYATVRERNALREAEALANQYDNASADVERLQREAATREVAVQNVAGQGTGASAREAEVSRVAAADARQRAQQAEDRAAELQVRFDRAQASAQQCQETVQASQDEINRLQERLEESNTLLLQQVGSIRQTTDLVTRIGRAVPVVQGTGTNNGGSRSPFTQSPTPQSQYNADAIALNLAYARNTLLAADALFWVYDYSGSSNNNNNNNNVPESNARFQQRLAGWDPADFSYGSAEPGVLEWVQWSAFSAFVQMAGEAAGLRFSRMVDAYLSPEEVAQNRQLQPQYAASNMIDYYRTNVWADSAAVLFNASQWIFGAEDENGLSGTNDVPDAVLAYQGTLAVASRHALTGRVVVPYNSESVYKSLYRAITLRFAIKQLLQNLAPETYGGIRCSILSYRPFIDNDVNDDGQPLVGEEIVFSPAVLGPGNSISPAIRRAILSDFLARWDVSPTAWVAMEGAVDSARAACDASAALRRLGGVRSEAVFTSGGGDVPPEVCTENPNEEASAAFFQKLLLSPQAPWRMHDSTASGPYVDYSTLVASPPIVGIQELNRRIDKNNFPNNLELQHNLNRLYAQQIERLPVLLTPLPESDYANGYGCFPIDNDNNVNNNNNNNNNVNDEDYDINMQDTEQQGAAYQDDLDENF